MVRAQPARDSGASQEPHRERRVRFATAATSPPGSRTARACGSKDEVKQRAQSPSSPRRTPGPVPRDPTTRQGGRHRPAALRHCANIRQAPDIINRWRRFYDSSAVLKSTRDCTILGWSIRRVGLIDITVGNATRLGASQRSATRRSASHHIATQRLSRRGSPAARARLARTAPRNDASVESRQAESGDHATAQAQQSLQDCAMT